MSRSGIRIFSVFLLVTIFLTISSTQWSSVFAVGDDTPGVQVDGLLDEEYTLLATVPPGPDNAPGDLLHYEGDTQCYWAFVVDRSYNDNVYSQSDTAYLLQDGWTTDHDFKKLDKSDHAVFNVTYGNNQSFSLYLDYVNQNSAGGNESYAVGTKSGQLSDGYSDGYAPQLSAVQTSIHWNLLNSGWQSNNIEQMLTQSPPYNYNDSGDNYWEWQMIYEFSIAKSTMGGACGTVTQGGAHNSPAKSGETASEVGNYVWLDANNNGIQDDGGADAGVENVTVYLRRASDNVIIRTTQTSVTGFYIFTNLQPGSYYVDFELPSGYLFTTRNAGANDAVDSDADLTNGTTPSFTLLAGESNLTLDAGLVLPPPPAASIVIKKYTNSQDADTPTGPLVPVGGAVTWTYVVTNTGNVNLTNVAVTDDKGVVVSCPKSALAIGETMTCTANGTAVAGQYANIGTVTGKPPTGANVTDTDPSHYFGSNPRINIIKYTNGQDADTPTGPLVPIGGAVAWTYEVENIGNVPLSNVVVTDDKGVIVSCPKTVLAIGETMTCTANGTAVAGQYANIGSVVGTPPVGSNVTDDNPSHYFGVVPGIAIKKYTNGEDADTPTGPIVAVGSTVTWTYEVRNTSAVPLSDVTVTDNMPGVNPVRISGDSNNNNLLDTGEVWLFRATGTAIAGQYANIGTAEGTSPGGEKPKDDDPSHYFGAAPDISIIKYTNGQDADTPTGPLVPIGGVVAWTYEVENTGNVPLSDVVVTDDKGVVVNCPKNVLAVGEVMICTANGFAVAGQYANIGTVVGTSPLGQEVTDNNPSHYFGVVPGIVIKKYTNGQDADTPTGPIVVVGSKVTWTYEVRNTSNLPLSDVTVTDNMPGVNPVLISGDDNNNDLLDLDEVWLYSATGTAVAGQYANIGTAEGTSPGGEKPKDDDPSHYFGAVPGIVIKKYTNGQDADTPTGPNVVVGSVVTWTYLVTNTGNVPLSNVSVTDNITNVAPSYISGDIDDDGVLDVGEVWLFRATGIAVAGQYANIGTVVATPPVGPNLTDDDPSHYFGDDDLPPTNLPGEDQPNAQKSIFLPAVQSEE